jgi:hypothetical protein
LPTKFYKIELKVAELKSILARGYTLCIWGIVNWETIRILGENIEFFLNIIEFLMIF